jgi:uncharacterized membrane protein YphA (DoxX/SURF4 family)
LKKISENLPIAKNNFLAKRADLRYSLWLARLVLGLVFLAAAWPKMLVPTDLAEAIVGYQLVPMTIIPFLALILPFLEFWSALAVLIGPRKFRRAGSFIIVCSLLVFMAAAVQGLVRGLDFECGCFGSDGRRPGFLFFLEDSFLFLVAIFIVKFEK